MPSQSNTRAKKFAGIVHQTSSPEQRAAKPGTRGKLRLMQRRSVKGEPHAPGGDGWCVAIGSNSKGGVSHRNLRRVAAVRDGSFCDGVVNHGDGEDEMSWQTGDGWLVSRTPSAAIARITVVVSPGV